jgi:glutamine cyclotransferase
MSASKKPSRAKAPPARRRNPAALVIVAIVAVGAIVGALITRRDAAPAVPGDSAVAAQASQATPIIVPEIVREFPHDAQAFTQGLLYRDGFLYESTGLNGRSSLRKVELETGRVVQRRAVDSQHFAEGLVDWGSRFIQLTYTSNVAFVYDVATFEPQTTFKYEGQGWGITRDDRRLIMSDGSAQLRFLEPDTFAERGRITVRDGSRMIENLNELEMVKGRVLANIWFEDRIAMIEPDSGRVTAWLDLSGLGARLVPAPVDPTGAGAVLNGIAYDEKADRLFVTGKLWPKLFEIRLPAGAAR